MKFPHSIVLIVIFAFSAFAQTGRMTPEELVTKHLASIGSNEALASVKSLVTVGKTRVAYRANVARNLAGVTQIGSSGDKVLLAMIFNSNEYPYEKIGYDGEKLTVITLPEGGRSRLGDFLKSNDVIFKDGLIGGVLSAAWSLRNADSKKPRLTYSGTEKINNRLAHELKYAPRGGGDLQISLFFDAETFRHVRTAYQMVISQRMTSRSDQAGRLRERRYRLIEEFSDFKTEGGLTLPHAYKISYASEEQDNTQWFEWIADFSQFTFNQTIDPAAFKFSLSN